MIYARINPETKEILEYPADHERVREWAKESNISVPHDVTLVDLSSWGWIAVDYVPRPALTTPGHKVVLDTPLWDGDRLVRTFKEVPRASDETEALWARVREKRNRMLSESDWVELPSVSRQRSVQWLNRWLDYRTRLRDLTSASDPEMVRWPIPPEN